MERNVSREYLTLGKITKRSFARAKKRLGIKKVTKKNIGRIAKAAAKGTGKKRSSSSSKSKSKRKSNPSKGKSGGGRRMGGKSLSRSLFKLARATGLLAPAAHAIVYYRGKDRIRHLCMRYGGYDPIHGKLRLDQLAVGYGPYVGTCLATYLIPKITGLIRRI